MQSELLFQQLTRQQQSLHQHRVFQLLQDTRDLQVFMSWHVFAVWDFMTLVKRLQRELTVVELPWTPPISAQGARLINDIVLGEESDLAPDGSALSHFELYLQAMQEVGADSSTIEQLVQQLRTGIDPKLALVNPAIPLPLRQFVEHSLEVAMHGSLPEVLGNFFFGREDVIPRMFQSLLDQWQLRESDAPVFVYYLQRHIELDSDEHGPAARQLIEEICGDDPQALQQLAQAAESAIDARRLLWDVVANSIQQKQTGRLQKAG